jgi:hypothetical protein
MCLNFKCITLNLLGSENKSGRTHKTFHIVVVFLIAIPVIVAIKWLIDQLSPWKSSPGKIYICFKRFPTFLWNKKDHLLLKTFRPTLTAIQPPPQRMPVALRRRLSGWSVELTTHFEVWTFVFLMCFLSAGAILPSHLPFITVLTRACCWAPFYATLMSSSSSSSFLFPAILFT